MRVAAFLVWVVAFVAALVPLLRRGVVGGPGTPRALRDELVKDPVCQTYVVRSRAVHPAPSPDAPYFCSAECARRWATESRG